MKIDPRRRLLKSTYLRSVLIVSSGTAIAQLLPVFLTPILTRVYSPDDLGLFALYSSYIGFATGALSLGYAHAIVSAKDDRDAALLLMLALLLIVPSAALITIVLVILVHFSLLGFGELPMVASIAMVISLIMTGAYFSLRYWLVRMEHYQEISRVAILQSSGRVLTQVGLGVLRPVWFCLVVGEIVGRALGLRRMWARGEGAVRRHGGTLRWQDLRAVAYRHRKFPMFAAPASLLDSLGPALHIPLITAVFGVSSAGQYSVANQVLVIPSVFIGTSVADVFHSRIARYARDEPQRAFSFFYLTAMGLFLVGALPAFVLYSQGEALFVAVLGEQWRTSGEVAEAVAPRVVSLLVVSPLSRVVMVYQGQELKLLYNGVTVSAVVLTYVLASQYGWEFIDTMARYTTIQVALHCVYFAVLVYIVHTGASRIVSER